MKTKAKIITSLVLSVLMLFTCVSVPVSAADIADMLVSTAVYAEKVEAEETEAVVSEPVIAEPETEPAPAEESEIIVSQEAEAAEKEADKTVDFNNLKGADSVTLQGAGTEDSPYIINTEEDLIAVALGKIDGAHRLCYRLNSDLELTADTWTPIGATDATAFTGIFDGDGHTISSTVLFQSTGMSGIFGVNKGTIKNLNVYVTIAEVATDTGALVATNYGTVENCYSSGSITATANKSIGGLVGVNQGTVTLSGSSVVVTASNSVVGGLVGKNYNGTITYSYATGDVTGRYVGGLIGEQYGYYNTAKTNYSYALGKVTGGDRAGGLIGYKHENNGTTYVEYCYAKGVVASGSSTGGLIGPIDGNNTYIRFCYYNKINTGNKYGFGISISDLKKQNEFYGWNFDNIWNISSDVNEGYPYIDLRGEEEFVISGIGSQFDPYIIENEQQLYWISACKLANSMSAYYLLADDITVTANFWTPIGRYSTFTGVFDGNGHTIYGINISNTNFGHCGLFDNNSGIIKNLNVSDTTIVGNTNTGAIVGANYGMLSNCKVTESSMSNVNEGFVGGMVGLNSGTVTECGVNCDVVSANSVVGCLIGRNENGTVQYSYGAGDVTGRYAGGLIGEQYGYYSTAKTINSYSMGKVTGSERAGGLIGYNHENNGTTYVEYCYARGLVAGSGSNGGLIGRNDNSNNILRYCYYNNANIGNKIGFSTSPSSMKNPDTFYGWDFDNIWTYETGVNSGYPVINLRGETPVVVLEGSGDEDDPYLIHNEEELWALVLDKGDYKLSIKNHYKLANDIEVTAAHWTPIGANGTSNFAGTFDGDGHTISGIKLSNNYYDYIGLFGYNSGTIKNLNVEAEIEGVNYAGCLVAYNTGKISNCSSSGSAAIAGDRYSGGLVGFNDAGVVELSDSSATVGDSNDISGGLVGINHNGTVRYSYATGNITGRYSGGLVGEQYGYYGTAKTNNSYAMGKVTGSERVGGLIGYNHENNGTTYVEYCYATGLVVGSGNTGGLVGRTDNSQNIIRYCYYNQVNTGNKIGFRLPVTAMTHQDSFYMWNFDNIWAIDEGGYPYIDLRGTVKEYELEGYGDADDPYLIYTERDLWALVDGTYDLNAKLYYQLQNDIVVTANYWTPIGSNGYVNFNGIFDGNGYTIYGLKFSNNDYYGNVGFIGVNTGTIKNLNVEAVFEGGTNVGAICAQNSGTVDGCSSTGIISNYGSGQYEVGGLVGYNTSKVKNSHSDSVVYAPNHNAGGLVGKNYAGGTVEYCYATGNVTGKYSGGLVGEQYGHYGTAKTNNSYAMGKVTGSERVGGLIGYTHENNGDTYTEYCYSNGKVSGNGTKGGLIGRIDGSRNTVTSSYYNSTLSEMSDINRGTPLDDNTMKLQASYVGWDFDTVWSIDSTVNGGYPYIWTMQPADTVNVTGITLDYTEKTMRVGDVSALIATITPSNALNKTVLWSTSNADIAYVSNGVVTACGAGTAVITATTADGSFTATCTVTVTEEVVPVVNVESVSLDKTNLSVGVGSVAKLTATVLPANATNKNVTWTSSNTSVATVDANGNVRGVKAGNVIITVKTDDGSKTASCKLTVTNTATTVAVTGVNLDKLSINADKGAEFKLNATVAPSNATNKAVSWTSSNPAIASVDENGVVTAKAKGSAVIIVTTVDGGKTASCTVTVIDTETPDAPSETDAYIEVSSAKVCAGDTFTLTVSFMNNPGINTFALSLIYDESLLTLDSVTLSDGILGQLEYKKKAVWLSNSDTDYSGAYLNLTFTAHEDIEPGTTPVTVSYNEGDICNYDEESINFAVVAGTVTVIDYIPGDINGDGIVNNKDLNRLMKYLAGDDVEVSEAALDVNGDSNVNNKDLNRLMKYLAGDDVEIF